MTVPTSAISDDNGVSVFDTTSGARVAGPEHPGAGWIVISGGLMAITRHDGQVMFANPVTLEPHGRPVAGGASAIKFLSLSRDGSLLMTLDGSRNVRLFDVATRSALGDPMPVLAEEGNVALRPDGRELAVESANGVALWDLDTAHWEQAACRMASRSLTRDEWDSYIGDLAPYRETCPGPRVANAGARREEHSVTLCRALRW